ncbi:hypothetical protein C0991_003066 [Blastosporella zonata]|nr:hypothetical protein C0991_003066 [Blastosporella zonata]
MDARMEILEEEAEEIVDTTGVEVINSPQDLRIKLPINSSNMEGMVALLLRRTMADITRAGADPHLGVDLRLVMEAMEVGATAEVEVEMEAEVGDMEAPTEAMGRGQPTVVVAKMAAMPRTVFMAQVEAQTPEAQTAAEATGVTTLETMPLHTKETVEEVPHTMQDVDEEGAGKLYYLFFTLIMGLYNTTIDQSTRL